MCLNGETQKLQEIFFFFVFIDYPLLWISHCLLQIQILSIYCSWFLCVIRKLKFAAGPFILANHADIKSLKALRVAPAGAPLNTSLQQDIVLQLCFSSSTPLGIKLLLLWVPAWDRHASFYHSQSHTHRKPCPHAEPCNNLELFPGDPGPSSPASWDGSHIPKVHKGQPGWGRVGPAEGFHTCSERKGGNYLDLSGKSRAPQGSCQFASFSQIGLKCSKTLSLLSGLF